MTNQPTLPPELPAEWKSVTSGEGTARRYIRPVTAQAWQRSKDYGVDPRRVEFVYLDEASLEQRRADNRDLIEAAAPYLEYLSQLLSQHPHIVALSDAEAWVLELYGTAEAFGGREAGIALGANWSEALVGNNGTGTALVLGEPVVIYGYEHYAQVYHRTTCFGTPIRHRGEVIGAIDVSVPNEYGDPSYVTLAQACIASIERTLERWSSARESENVDNALDLHNVIATALHDLKQPLTTIRATGQLGAKSAQDEKDRHWFQSVVEQVDRLVPLLDSLLDPMKREDIVVTSPVPILREVLEEVKLMCQASGIEVSLKVEQDAPVALRPTLIKRAMRNLVINAIEAMTGGGDLRVTIDRRDDQLLISVADSGSGIPAEIRTNVFNPFVSGREDGTGLGLSMVYQTIAHEHGGRVWFTSESGQGTTMFVQLPLHQDNGASSI